MLTPNILMGIGYALISYAGYKLFRVNKDCVVVNKRTFKKIEENIREDERKTVMRIMFLSNNQNKGDSDE